MKIDVTLDHQTVGDLVSEEDRHLVLLTEVLPLPLLPDGTLPASLEGEELLGIEFVWTEISDTEIKGCSSPHLVHRFAQEIETWAQTIRTGSMPAAGTMKHDDGKAPHPLPAAAQSMGISKPKRPNHRHGPL